MENIYTVYMHVCPKGLKYIGITKQHPESRWNHGKGYSKNPYFWRTIQKYGWDSIEHRILHEGLTHEEAEKKERELIALHNTANCKFGYNCTMGGESNFTLSDLARARISAAHRGKERKRRVVNKYSHDGKYIASYMGTVEAAVKSGFRESLRSKITESCNGNRASAGGYVWRYADTVNGTEDIEPTKIRIGKHSKIVQYGKDGEVLNVFPSFVQVADYLQTSERNAISSVSNCCLGKSRMAYGYKWEYA